MISAASICGEATFDAPGQLVADLRQVNYFFGSNGTGKSTIAKVLAEPDRFPACSVTGSGDFEVLLFNEEFIRAAIRESTTMPGVFTIGDDAGEAADRITKLEGEQATLEASVTSWRATLADKRAEKAAALARLSESAWLAKKALGETLQGAFTGLNNSKEAFRDKLLTVDAADPYDGPSLEEMQIEAALVLGEPPATLDALSSLALRGDLEQAWSHALAEPVLSSSTNQMSRLIAELGNADWVHAGLPHLEHSVGVCPFCQQTVPQDLSERIRSVFDGNYEEALASISAAGEEYRALTAELLASAADLAESGHPLVDTAVLAAHVERLRADVAVNLHLFLEKLSTPSKVVAYVPLAPTISAIADLVALWNVAVVENNKLATEFKDRRSALVRAAWTYLTSVGARPLLDEHRETTSNLSSAIASLEAKISDAADGLIGKSDEIKDLRKKVTSSRPTADALNDTLLAFGFDTFKVDLSEDGSTYRLARPDGANAALSLSEGERNFIAFLYFFHLVSGTLDAEAAPLPRVVVVDDPVSSLDSQVLFVVSALVRRLAAKAENPAEHALSQLFVFTHNAYFHREVTFDKSRGDGCKKTETFWAVRRAASTSIVERRESNPVSTGYELLWDEVRMSSGGSTGVANAMRRILEYYFQILGGEKLQDIEQRFLGQDQLVCRALVSWANQDSHVPADDMFVTAERYENDRYQEVFKRVFEETGHGAHYRMMMKIGDGEESADLHVAGTP